MIEASPARVAPPCPQVEAGCGGCGWQHVDPVAQRSLKDRIVDDALRRIGKLEPPAITHASGLGVETGGRTTVRAAVDPEGQLGFRRHHAHDIVPVEATGCLVSHPLVDEVLRTAWFSGKVTEATVRRRSRHRRTPRDRRARRRPRTASCPRAPCWWAPTSCPPVTGPGSTRRWPGAVGASRLRASSSPPRRRPALSIDLAAAALGDALRPGAIDDRPLCRRRPLRRRPRPPHRGGPYRDRRGQPGRHRRRPGQPRRPAPGSRSSAPTSASGAPPRPIWSSPTRPVTASAPRSSNASAPPAPERWPWCPVTPAPWAGTPDCSPVTDGPLESVTLADLFPHTPHVEVVDRLAPAVTLPGANGYARACTLLQEAIWALSRR